MELAYSRLGLRSLPLWRELEQVTSSQVLTLTGGVARGETEDLDLLAWLADGVVVMRQGQVVEQASARQLLAAPATAYARELLDAVSSSGSTATRHRRTTRR